MAVIHILPPLALITISVVYYLSGIHCFANDVCSGTVLVSVATNTLACLIFMRACRS